MQFHQLRLIRSSIFFVFSEKELCIKPTTKVFNLPWIGELLKPNLSKFRIHFLCTITFAPVRLCYTSAIFSLKCVRLFAHSEDADIDEPFQAPTGYTLGKSDSSETTQPQAPSEETGNRCHFLSFVFF